MIKKNIIYISSSIVTEEAFEGELLETKVERVTTSNEPISDGAEIIYTDRAAGVLPEYNIRTDRFELAIDAMDKVTATNIAKRAETAKKIEESVKSPDIVKNEPIQGTTDGTV